MSSRWLIVRALALAIQNRLLFGVLSYFRDFFFFFFFFFVVLELLDTDHLEMIEKGQTCVVRNPCPVTITLQKSDGTWSFAIPRPLDGGTIIGGTKQPHDWDPNPSPETRNQILTAAAKWFPFTPESQGKFDLIHDIVGRRPARQGGLRIEFETVPVPASTGSVKADGSTTPGHVVHAYGAAGSGYELSWGVAEDVTGLMAQKGLLSSSNGASKL